MLFYYYDLASEDKFDLLFKDTYIHEHPTKEKNSYYVLTFNFSGLTGKQGTALEEEFNEKVYKTIKEFKNSYGFDTEISKHLSAASMLNGLLSDIQIQLNGHDIYVIIDE